jgi:hypothetical protein
MNGHVRCTGFRSPRHAASRASEAVVPLGPALRPVVIAGSNPFGNFGASFTTDTL